MKKLILVVMLLTPFQAFAGGVCKDLSRSELAEMTAEELDIEFAHNSAIAKIQNTFLTRLEKDRVRDMKHLKLQKTCIRIMNNIIITKDVRKLWPEGGIKYDDK